MAAAEEQTRLQIGHVLFIDIVGYSKLLVNQQSELQHELNQVVSRTSQFRESDAQQELTRLPTGDGMALVFRESPEAPAQCAVEIARALKEHPRIALRMGIHSGPISEVADVNQRQNIAGAGINIAQRVMDCGDAGHILVSKHVAEDLEQHDRWRPLLHDLGSCEVKHGVRIDISNLYSDEVGNPQLPKKLQAVRKHRAHVRWAEVAIGLLVLGAIVAAFMIVSRRPTTSLTAIPEKSIAVLPFVDMSSGKDQEYFCDGISEEILDALAKVEGLRVVARTSSFSFKEKNADVSEIARKLNVQNILEGSLRREGNRVRITAQLINARNGFHLWSETYERELQGVFAVQDEITRSIVDALKIKLAVSLPAHEQRNTEAYDLYLQGRFFLNKSGEEALRKALSFFQRALDKDPTFGRAWSGIASTWAWLADAYVKPLEAYPASREAALKAISLDEKDAEAHCSLGDAKRVLDWDFAGDEAALKRALQLDPNSALAHFTLALLRFSQCDLEEGLAEIRQAAKLDPLSPAISNFATLYYLETGRYDDAIAEGQRTLELDPTYVYQDSNVATAYREKGNSTEAIALYLKGQEAMHLPSSGLAITYARRGRQAEARRILDELVKQAQTRYVAAEKIAAVYVALGQNDEAFRWLDRAAAERSGNLHFIAFEREFVSLRSDPRFADLLRRIGVDPAKAFARQQNP